MLMNKVFSKAFPLVLGLCLLAGALGLTGCQNETEPQFIDRQFIPAGEWNDDFGTSYVITKDKVTYHTEPSEWEGITYDGTDLEGSIISAVDFSETSGVLIIQVTKNEGIFLTLNKYTCVYYRDYSASHIYLANPIDGSYAPIEADSLNGALKTFTEGNVSTHVAMWGSGYNFKE
jgi:hypothetical protein